MQQKWVSPTYLIQEAIWPAKPKSLAPLPFRQARGFLPAPPHLPLQILPLTEFEKAFLGISAKSLEKQHSKTSGLKSQMSNHGHCTSHRAAVAEKTSTHIHTRTHPLTLGQHSQHRVNYLKTPNPSH